MNFKNTFLSVLLLVISLSCKEKSKEVGAKMAIKNNKPNIVLLFIDDYGWSDIGYRNNAFNTPNLDKLKSESFDFQRAYIPTPTCSPSRYSLLTGKEAVRGEMVRHIKVDPKKP